VVCPLLKKPLRQGHQNHNRNHQEEFFLALLQLLLRQKQIKRKFLVFTTCLLWVKGQSKVCTYEPNGPSGWCLSAASLAYCGLRVKAT